jgi:hypothetical protein
MDVVSEEKDCSRSIALVIHINDKQADFLIDTLRMPENKWTWTICSWVKETGSTLSQGSRMRYETELWLCYDKNM